MKLDTRLSALSDILDPGHTVADIGADHGYLLANLLTESLFQRAIGVELNKGPFESALETVRAENLEDRAEIRLGNGLLPLKPGEADAVVVAGMGGTTICGILQEGKDRLRGVSQLVLSPQSAHGRVRSCLQELGFSIRQETLVRMDRLYLIIRAVPGQDPPYTWGELEAGPVLIRERPPLFCEYIREMTQERRRILESLKEARRPVENRTARLQEEISRLEVLCNE